MLDGDLNTLWAEEGEVYLEFELDREYTVENIELIFNPNSNRSAIFEVYYSTDVENWSTTKRYNSDPSADGKTWEKYTFDNPLKAKYIRYAAFGSDKSMWNGVKEIRFKAN